MQTKELNIKQHFTSVEHPQANGQVKPAKRVILWAYRTTPQSTKGGNPFRLTFGTKVMILVAVKELRWRMAHPLDHNANFEATLEELDFIDESGNFAVVTEVVIK